MKFDGYRLVIVKSADKVQLWSRNGNDLTDRFPEIAAAATSEIKGDAIIDGEVVAYDGDRLSFDLLQQRLANRPSVIRALAGQHPASFVGFDLLSRDGVDLRPQSWSDRRAALEALAADWHPPLQLSPYTLDRSEAERWFVDYRPVGIEGLVVKGSATPYLPGRRGWIKVKNRETRDIVVGAVIGPIEQPEVVVAGLPDADGNLIIVGRTTALNRAQSDSLGKVLRSPSQPHPWPELIGSGHFGGHDQVVITHVDPIVVAEVTADTALQAGRFRHPLRYVRNRLDLNVRDVLPIHP
jgi:ATP-dependent DNA ligase